MFSEISELKSIREQKSRLSERENELSEPQLTDLSLIPMIYECFCQIQDGRSCPPRREGVHQRKKFIFVVLFLFSPSTLAGGKITKGIRDRIADLFVGCSPSNISHNCADVMFQFQQYKDFRKDIEYLYTEILNRLKFKGLINE